MKFLAAKCPACSGELQVPEDKDFVKCMYCGVDVKVRDAIRISLDANVPNLLELANSSLKSGNNEEAYHYFNKILEFDIKNYDAWFGKAISVSKLSTLAISRHQEMLNYFDTAVKYYNKEDIDNYKLLVCTKIKEFCWEYYELAKNHKDEYIGVDSTWPEYISQCWNIINVFEYSFSNYYKDINTLKWINYICEDNLKGTIYSERELMGNGFKIIERKKEVNDKRRKELLRKIQNTLIEWRKLDPQAWIKQDQWITEVGEIKKANQKMQIISFTASLLAGIIVGIFFGSIIDLPKKSDSTIIGICITVFITLIGTIIANTIFKKSLPPEPKGLKD